MANTVVRTGLNIDVTFDGSTALDFATDATIALPNGGYYNRIEYKPAAAGSSLTVRATTSTGARVFYFYSVDGSPQKIDLPREFHKFYVVGNQATATDVLLLRLAD